MRCIDCDGEFDDAFRYCPWCAAPQRSKLVEYFRGHPLLETEPVGLRATRYLVDTRHVRLSIWDDEQARAAIALEEYEARRLAAFLAGRQRRRPAPSLRERVRARVELR